MNKKEFAQHHSSIGIFLFLILITFSLLNGCSTMSRKDGPPSFYVDDSKVPNASPKIEPRSKYGNYASYRVFGKRYYTMASSKNYEEQGIASWYGTKFHRQRTSSGERYDMLAMTAAHKTLPLPTYVQVTNLQNGKKIIVKVNDRGPFESNRIIDLSYVAAKKLGMVGHGTAMVDVKAIDPLEYNRPHFEPVLLAENNKQIVAVTPHYVSASSGHKVYLQIGAFRNKLFAERLKNHLSTVISAPITVARKPTNHLYKVQVGPFKDIATAEQMTKHLRALGVKDAKKLRDEAEA